MNICAPLEIDISMLYCKKADSHLCCYWRASFLSLNLLFYFLLSYFFSLAQNRRMATAIATQTVALPAPAVSHVLVLTSVSVPSCFSACFASCPVSCSSAAPRARFSLIRCTRQWRKLTSLSENVSGCAAVFRGFPYLRNSVPGIASPLAMQLTGFTIHWVLCFLWKICEGCPVHSGVIMQALRWVVEIALQEMSTNFFCTVQVAFVTDIQYCFVSFICFRHVVLLPYSIVVSC